MNPITNLIVFCVGINMILLIEHGTFNRMIMLINVVLVLMVGLLEITRLWTENDTSSGG